MSTLSPRYLLEYRAARAAMEMGNIGPSKLIDMLNKEEVYFFHEDIADFTKCLLCSGFIESHPSKFLKCTVADLPIKSAVAQKLVAAGKLTQAKAIMAERSLKFVAVAARNELCCVLQPNVVVWDNIEVCKMAKVDVITIQEFLDSF